jgi:ribonuclease P protein component
LCPGSKRFPARVRLTKPAEFQRVFKQCRYRAGNRWMTVLATPNVLGSPRLGLAISRKVARTAVARNRIKRLVRESFRHNRELICPLDIVVLGRSGIATQTNDTLNTALEKLWKQLIESCAGSSSN